MFVGGGGGRGGKGGGGENTTQSRQSHCDSYASAMLSTVYTCLKDATPHKLRYSIHTTADVGHLLHTNHPSSHTYTLLLCSMCLLKGSNVQDCCRLSWVATDCPRLLQTVPGCHRLSRVATDCPGMSQTS